jgi:enoyl-CoA hydratase/carnithine racemase
VNRPVRLEHDGGLAIATIDSPPLNLFDGPMWESLDGVISELEAGEPRAVLIRAEGRVVSGGVDVSLFAAQEGVDDARALFDGLVSLTRRVERLECPVVFAAHALCLTWAFELALGCDLILAAESAAFGLVETVVGLTPAMGGTQRLAERAGSGRAREFVMTGRPCDAATMERWGVVNRVFGDDDFDRQARAFAASLAAGPTRAHAATKRVIGHYVEGGVDQADREVAAIAGALFATSDLQNAVRTFLEQGPGKATFEGR